MLVPGNIYLPNVNHRSMKKKSYYNPNKFEMKGTRIPDFTGSFP